MSVCQSPSLTNFFNKKNVARNVPLASYTTMKVGGPAQYFFQAQNKKDIAEVQLACLEHGLKLHMLSGGSNTLFSDQGFDGLVLKLSKSFDYLQCENPNEFVSVGASLSYAKLTKQAIVWGFGPALGFCGTPGLLGGALRMNAGTKMGVIGDIVESISGIEFGHEKTFTKKDLVFSYRANNLPKNFIITNAVLRCPKNKFENPQLILKKATEYKTKRRDTQPTKNSAGSVFKNPYPEYAGKLIENCRLKGLQYGGAQISTLHANFIVNQGNATANDVKFLMDKAQRIVFESQGIQLVPEIRMVGKFS